MLKIGVRFVGDAGEFVELGAVLAFAGFDHERFLVDGTLDAPMNFILVGGAPVTRGRHGNGGLLALPGNFLALMKSRGPCVVVAVRRN